MATLYEEANCVSREKHRKKQKFFGKDDFDGILATKKECEDILYHFRNIPKVVRTV